jgi:hypothetical protein
MRKPTTFLPTLTLGVAGALSVAAPSLADPITYTEHATATGSLGGVAFTDATVLLTMTNDTTNVIGGPTFFEIFGTVTVSVNGGAPVTLTDSMGVFSDVTLSPATVGFEDLALLVDILDTASALLGTYDLTTSIGPISDTAFLSATVPFPTTGGDLILTDVAGPTSTFTATTVAVPAPLIGHGVYALTFGCVLLGAKLLERSKKSRSPGKQRHAAKTRLQASVFG